MQTVWMKCFIDFPTSSSSRLLSQSANENNSLNQTFCSFFPNVWISEITGKISEYFSTGRSCIIADMRECEGEPGSRAPIPILHPHSLPSHPYPYLCLHVSSNSRELCPRLHPRCQTELSTLFRASMLDLRAQGKHFRFSQEMGSS